MRRWQRRQSSIAAGMHESLNARTAPPAASARASGRRQARRGRGLAARLRPAPGRGREDRRPDDRLFSVRRRPLRAPCAWRRLFCWINPASNAGQAPPAFSISWNSAQAARQSCSVRSSMPPEPAAGSATLARLDSSSRMSCVLRAMRRAKPSGRPSAAVNGSTVIASAPPRPAANTAMVARSMFTYGSRRVIMRQAVSAEMKAGSGCSPQASSTAPTVSASARNFAMVRNWSASAASRKKIIAPRRVERDAARFERAQIGERIAEREGQLLRLRAAGFMHRPAVGDRERSAETLARRVRARWPRTPARSRATAPRLARPAAISAERIVAAADVGIASGVEPALLHQRGEMRRARPWPRGVRLNSIAMPARDRRRRARARCRLPTASRPKPWAPTAPGRPASARSRRFADRAAPACWRRPDRDDRPAPSPARARPARAGDRARVGRRAVERLDAQPVIGLADQRLVESARP